MESARIRLLAHTPAHLRALLEGENSYESAFAITVANGVRESLTSPEVSESFQARLRDDVAADPWRDGFGIVHLEEQRLIGFCSYVAPPDGGSAVEIGYFVAPDFAGRGYATEAVTLLIDHARASGRVRTLRAHTLPEQNASTRILEKCGFQYRAELIDSVDGRIWRWEREIETGQRFTRPL